MLHLIWKERVETKRPLNYNGNVPVGVIADGIKYDTLTEASKVTGMSVSWISKCLQTGRNPRFQPVRE